MPYYKKRYSGRGRTAWKSRGKYGARAAKSRPQRANFSKWASRSVNRFPRIKKGSAATKSGSLTIRGSSTSLAKTNRNFPHTNFVKFYFCTPSLQSPAAATADKKTHGPMGFRDIIYSNSSVAAKYLSFMYLDLGKTHLYWATNPIGNSLICNTADATKICSLSQNALGDATAAAYIAQMITMDRIPQGAESPHPLYAAIATAATYNTPNHVIVGVDFDLTFNSASVADQWITVKLCRATSNDPLAPEISPANAKELVNKQTVTDARYWETLWQHSWFMPRMSTFSGEKNKSVFCKKKINMNYLRSTVRKTSSAVGHLLGAVQDYAAMLSPHIVYDTTGKMYNNLAVGITSRVVDDQYVSRDVVTTGTGTLVANHLQAITTGTEVATLRKLDATKTSFAKFGITGTVTQRFRCRDYTRQKPKDADDADLSDVESIPDHDHEVINVPLSTSPTPSEAPSHADDIL